jgi:hypothetical protein
MQSLQIDHPTFVDVGGITISEDADQPVATIESQSALVIGLDPEVMSGGINLNKCDISHSRWTSIFAEPIPLLRKMPTDPRPLNGLGLGEFTER